MGTANNFLTAFGNKSADSGGNGYASVCAAMKYAQKELTQETPQDPIYTQISDANNNRSSTYLFDINVDDHR